MFNLVSQATVYLACGMTNLRKSYNGLSAIIKLKFKLDPYSKCIFAFCNRSIMIGASFGQNIISAETVGKAIEDSHLG